MPWTKRNAQKQFRRYVLCSSGLACPFKGWQWADKVAFDSQCYCGKDFAQPVRVDPPPAPWRTEGDGAKAASTQSFPAGKRTRVEELIFLADQCGSVLGEEAATTKHMRAELEDARRARDASRPAALRLKDAEEKADRRTKAKEKAHEKAQKAREEAAAAEAESQAADKALAEAVEELRLVKASLGSEVPSAQASPAFLPGAFLDTLPAEQAGVVRQLGETFAAWQRQQAASQASFFEASGATPVVVTPDGDPGETAEMDVDGLVDDLLAGADLEQFLANAGTDGADLEAAKRQLHAQLRGRAQEAKRARLGSRSLPAGAAQG